MMYIIEITLNLIKSNLWKVRLVNWEEVLYDTEDVNHIFYSFYTKISETVEKHVPLRKTSMFVY